MKHNTKLSTDIAAQSKEFWEAKGLEDLNRFTIKRDFIEGNGYNRQEYKIELDKLLTEKIASISKGNDILIFAVLVTVLNITIFKYSNESNVTIGMPVYGKSSDNLIIHNEILPLVSYLDEHSSFRALIPNIQRNIIECYKNQYYSIDNILRLSKINYSTADLASINIMLKGFHSDEGISTIVDSQQDNINLFIEKNDNDSISINVLYNAMAYKEETLKRFMIHFLKVLKDGFNNPEKNIGEMEIIDEEEKQELICGFNNTHFSYPNKKVIYELFEEQVLRTPDNVAVTYKGKKITYKQLNERANQLARLLLNRGVNPGDCVGLMVERNIEMIIGMMGILKAGCTYVPVDPDYPEKRKEYILDNSNVTAVVVNNAYNNIEYKLFNINQEDMSTYSTFNLNIEKDSKQLAYIIYTSGSTGIPKGVMIEHHSVVNLIKWVNETFEIDENDTLLFITSMCFDLSVYDVFGMLSSGGRIVIAEKQDVQNPVKLKELIKSERITFWDSVPSTMNHLINALENSKEVYLQEDLKLVFMSGDWIPVTLPNKIEKYFPNASLISLGGATEGTVWSIYYPIERGLNYDVSIPYGKPIANNYFYILDKNMKPVPQGVIGELYIGGVGVARGYMNEKEKTNESFVKNIFIEDKNEMMYKTGDLGRMLSSGNIEFIGRKDHQVKIRGFRIELGEIANVLLEHEDITEAVTMVKGDENDNKYIVGYIIASREMTTFELRRHLLGKLPDYMIPQYFIQLDGMPLNSNGKIDRNELLKLDEKSSKELDYEKPRNESEYKLAKIWEEVLDVKTVGINHNFFELGGHSLAANIVVQKINNRLGIKIALLDMFTYQTIKQISDNVINKMEQNDCHDHKNIVLLKRGEGGNIFYIHAVQGTIDAYVQLCNNISHNFNHWGIQFNKINKYTPENISIKELAQGYIEIIKSIQKEGPYNIIGWSMGGSISFEIVRQLEEQGENVSFLGMIDTKPPEKRKDKIQPFSLQTELDFIEKAFSGMLKVQTLKNEDSMTQIWGCLIELIESAELKREHIFENIDKGIIKYIPNYEQMSIDEFIETMNIIRTLGKSASYYMPEGKIKTITHVFKAKDTIISIHDWDEYCLNEVRYQVINGNHYSIFDETNVIELAKRITVGLGDI